MDNIMREDAEAIARADLDWSKFHGKTVLIAGANGYVPQYFVHGLLRRNQLFDEEITVTALCRNASKARQRFGEYLDRPDFSLLIQDVLDEIRIDRHLDFVIDAASPAGVKNSNQDPLATFEANVMGCSSLLKLAGEHGAEFLYLSSVDVYGTGTGERFSESGGGVLDPLNVRSVYASAKRAAETLCACCAHQGAVCKVVRPSQILGSGVALDDGRLHIDFIAQLLRSDQIVLKGDGTPMRTFIYVTDAIIGMLYVIAEGRNGEAYNVCSEDGEASVLELAHQMARQIKSRTITIGFDQEARKSDPAVKHAVSRVCASSEKLRGLGWRAEVPLEEACRRMMESYQVPF